MTIDELKSIMLFSIPAGVTREGQLTFSFEAIANGAERLGLEVASKRQTFAMLRDCGFMNARSDGERRIAANLRTYATFVVPTMREMIIELEASK